MTGDSVLVIAAHADDEVLGCGGTIARYVSEGSDVHILVLADGVTARDADYQPKSRLRDVEDREAVARNAASILGASPPIFLRLPDNRCDSVPLIEVVKKIEKVVDSLRPETIFTHHANDLNVDHRVAHIATLTASRPQPGMCVRSIYAFENLSSTEWAPAGLGEKFHPTRYVDIGAHTQAKLEALAAYYTEVRSFPHPRSPEAVESLWRTRGAQVGVQAAEAFVVVREVI